MKRVISLLLALVMTVLLVACAKQETPAKSNDENKDESTLVYGSADYTRINPAMDEHCEINVLLFSGLTAHDAEDQVVPGLAERWEYDEETFTYTFHIRDGVKWHDGEPFTAEDVKFTIEAIMDPENGAENAPNYEDVQEITVPDEKTVCFRLAEPNVAFLEYMTMAILPKHLLEGEDMQQSDFFRAPVGTGPYKLESWDVGQAIVMVKNEDYYLGAPHIDKVIFKIVADDNAQAVQLESGELDIALLDPKNAANFEGKDDFTCYDMTTADYRGILFNFWNDYWTENRDIIPAVCYALDRQAIIDSVLLGQGMPAYSPLQRNIYNNENVEHYDYNPEKAKEVLENAGCTMGADGFYERNGEKIGFVISVMSGEQDRIDIAQAAAQQLREVGIDCTVEIPATTPIRSSARTRVRITPATPTPRSMSISRWRVRRTTRTCAESTMTSSRRSLQTTRRSPLSATSMQTTWRPRRSRALPRIRCWVTTAWVSSGTSTSGRSANKQKSDGGLVTVPPSA